MSLLCKFKYAFGVDGRALSQLRFRTALGQQAQANALDVSGADLAGAGRCPPAFFGWFCFVKTRSKFGRAGSPLPAAPRINSVHPAPTDKRFVAALVRARKTRFVLRSRAGVTGSGARPVPHLRRDGTRPTLTLRHCVCAVKNWTRGFWTAVPQHCFRLEGRLPRRPKSVGVEPDPPSQPASGTCETAPLDGRAPFLPQFRTAPNQQARGGALCSRLCAQDSFALLKMRCVARACCTSASA